MINTYFPNPAVQAMILLDQTENDLCTAIELALMNARKDDIGDNCFWFAVIEALTGAEQVN